MSRSLGSLCVLRKQRAAFTFVGTTGSKRKRKYKNTKKTRPPTFDPCPENESRSSDGDSIFSFSSSSDSSSYSSQDLEGRSRKKTHYANVCSKKRRSTKQKQLARHALTLVQVSGLAAHLAQRAAETANEETPQFIFVSKTESSTLVPPPTFYTASQMTGLEEKTKAWIKSQTTCFKYESTPLSHAFAAFPEWANANSVVVQDVVQLLASQRDQQTSFSIILVDSQLCFYTDSQTINTSVFEKNCKARSFVERNWIRCHQKRLVSQPIVPCENVDSVFDKDSIVQCSLFNFEDMFNDCIQNGFYNSVHTGNHQVGREVNFCPSELCKGTVLTNDVPVSHREIEKLSKILPSDENGIMSAFVVDFSTVPPRAVSAREYINS